MDKSGAGLRERDYTAPNYNILLTDTISALTTLYGKLKTEKANFNIFECRTNFLALSIQKLCV
ncbi:MAG: hypothetical protein LE179_03460 [Endomicrobium sp.]|nr:hypothetical protein [Endomicrobium sp.]